MMWEGQLIWVGVSYVKLCAESKNEHLICRSLYVKDLFDIPLPHYYNFYQFLGKSILSITLNKVKYYVIIKPEKHVFTVISAWITLSSKFTPTPLFFHKFYKKFTV